MLRMHGACKADGIVPLVNHLFRKLFWRCESTGESSRVLDLSFGVQPSLSRFLMKPQIGTAGHSNGLGPVEWQLPLIMYEQEAQWNTLFRRLR
jgi:hypothetical protein